MSLTPSPVTRASVWLSYGNQYSQTPYQINATWTNLGPMTTTFTPTVARCTSGPHGDVVVMDNADPDQNVVRWGCDASKKGRVPSFVQCQPSASAYSPLWTRQPTEYWLAFFSPGIYCPSGYTTAKAFTVLHGNLSSENGNYFRTRGTHVYCCPSGYSSTFDTCESVITTAMSTTLCNYLGEIPVSTVSNLRGLPHNSTSYSEFWNRTAFSYSSGLPAVTAEAWVQPVYLIHQQSDVPKGNPTRGPSWRGLVLRIVVPVIVVLAAAIGALVFFKRRREKAKEEETQSDIPLMGMGAPKKKSRRPRRKRPNAAGRDWHWA